MGQEKEIKSGGRVYKIRALKRRQMSRIEDEAISVAGSAGKLKWGTWKDMHCVEGIVEWDIKNKAGEVVKINLENVQEYMSNDDVEKIWVEVSDLSTAGESKKKE